MSENARILEVPRCINPIVDVHDQPVVDDMPSELTEAAETCENVLPMKRSVYHRS